MAFIPHDWIVEMELIDYFYVTLVRSLHLNALARRNSHGYHHSHRHPFGYPANWRRRLLRAGSLVLGRGLIKTQP